VGLDCLEQRRAWRDRASALAAAPVGPAQHLLERRVCQRVALLPQLLQLAWPLVRLAPDQLVAQGNDVVARLQRVLLLRCPRLLPLELLGGVTSGSAEIPCETPDVEAIAQHIAAAA